MLLPARATPIGAFGLCLHLFAHLFSDGLVHPLVASADPLSRSWVRQQCVFESPPALLVVRNASLSSAQGSTSIAPVGLAVFVEVRVIDPYSSPLGCFFLCLLSRHFRRGLSRCIFVAVLVIRVPWRPLHLDQQFPVPLSLQRLPPD